MVNEIQTITFRDDTIEGLAKKIEEYQNNSSLVSKYSLPFYDTANNEFCVIIVYPKSINTQQKTDSGLHSEQCLPKSESRRVVEKKPTETVSNRVSNINKSYSGGFQITKEVETRWKNMKPVYGTKKLLNKKGYSWEEINAIKTQWDAHIILNNLKKENI